MNTSPFDNLTTAHLANTETRDLEMLVLRALCGYSRNNDDGVVALQRIEAGLDRGCFQHLPEVLDLVRKAERSGDHDIIDADVLRSYLGDGQLHEVIDGQAKVFDLAELFAKDPPDTDTAARTADHLKQKAHLAEIRKLGGQIANLPDDADPAAALSQLQAKVLDDDLTRHIQGSTGPRSFADDVASWRERIQKLQGREWLGLPSVSLPSIDQATKGLRGFILLAGRPGSGKTSLAVQLATEAVINDETRDSCLVFYSLEMSRMDIWTRMVSNISRLAWWTVTTGRDEDAIDQAKTPLERQQILQDAINILTSLGPRLVIHDSTTMTDHSFDTMLAQIRLAKRRAGVSQAIVLVDYLQVWPSEGFTNAIDKDQNIIGQLLRIQHATDDCFLVISEKNKGGFDTDDLTAVMGTARATYSPDAVFMLRTGEHHDGPENGPFTDVDLVIPKGRDGFIRKTKNNPIKLSFHHQRSLFTENLGREPIKDKE